MHIYSGKELTDYARRTMKHDATCYVCPTDKQAKRKFTHWLLWIDTGQTTLQSRGIDASGHIVVCNVGI